MFRISQLSHTEQPFAVVHRSPHYTRERIWHFFATFADADVYRQEAMEAESNGLFICNGCLRTYRWPSQISRHMPGCEGQE